MSLDTKVTEERDADHSRLEILESQFSSKMYHYCREIIFMLGIMFTTYAAFQTAPPKTSKSPTPVPFFPQTSLVADFYQGHIGPPFERVAGSDISFVMYYAPWDAESQATRSQFKLVAQYYYKQVYFAAINCWQPLGECKQQFAKVQHFPVLIVYTQLTKGIQYKGVKEATHMIHFLSSVLHSVERIDSVNDIVQLMNFHDAVVIGCFDFKGNLGGQGYHTFYTTSLKLLEKDPYREIGFGVITNVKVANELGIHLAPTIRLYLWNETLEYGSDEPYTPEALTKWVVANAHQVSVWLSPPGIKSLTLSPYVEEDSVMILFTPRNLLYTVNYNYNLLREVGQEYYNCDDNPWVKDFVHYLGNERAMSRDMYTDLELQCSQWREKVRREELTAPPIQVVSHFWANGSCSGRRRCKMCTTCSDKCLVNAQDVSKDCKCDGGPGFDSYPHHQVCWKQTHHGSNVGSSHPPSVKTSMLTGKDDERSSENLIEAAIEESCLRFHQAHNAHTPVFPRATYHRKTPRNFTGLACRTNKTLSFLAMDSVQFHQFAEGLGVNVLARKDKTAVVIFNAVDESSYLLEAELSKGSLVDFIVNYTEGFLSRSLRSTARKPIALNRYPEINSQNCQQDEGSICVLELTTDTFFSTVLDKGKAVVVLYHTPYCGFCHGVAHIFLTVARYFRTVAKLQFARIDGEHNDLPWEYTMDHFPAILFFPARRKSESRVFPRHLPVTVPNLVNFVLANLGPSESKLQGLIGLCAAWERGHDDKSARDCLTRVRQECLTIIANSLAACRTTRLRRRFYLDSSSVRDSVSRHHQQLLYKKMKLLFMKLQHIKEIHLLLGSLDRLREDSREFRIIQSIFQVYLCSFNNGSADIPTSPETESIPVIDTRQATLQEHENVKDEW